MPAVASATFLRDSILYLRDDLRTGVTDPISASRGTNEQFVLTEYPDRPVRYPIVTIKDAGIRMERRLGMASEQHLTRLSFEVRVWGKDVSQRDKLAQEIIERLRGNEYDGTGNAIANNLFGLRVDSVVNVSEPGTGVKSKVITVTYDFIQGAS